jgi:hypothetical protein
MSKQHFINEFKKATNGKYPDIALYTRSISPVGKNALCKYQITFVDHSSIEVIMSQSQRIGIVRSKIYNSIKCIGGLGYVKLL